jgi:hypothetical protein
MSMWGGQGISRGHEPITLDTLLIAERAASLQPGGQILNLPKQFRGFTAQNSGGRGV